MTTDIVNTALIFYNKDKTFHQTYNRLFSVTSLIAVPTTVPPIDIDKSKKVTKTLNSRLRNVILFFCRFSSLPDYETGECKILILSYDIQLFIFVPRVVI
jgi:hypothetical protein